MLWKKRDCGQLEFIKCLALYQTYMRPTANETSSVCNTGWRVNEILSTVHMNALKGTFYTIQDIIMIILPIHRRCKNLSESVHNCENKHKSQN